MAHELILPAKQIPIGSTVRKQRGNTDYVLAEKLEVWRRDTKEKTRERKIELTPESDEVLLLAAGYAQIESKDTELVWLATPQEFSDYVRQQNPIDAESLTF